MAIDIDDIFIAAQSHGAASDPDHEVGDLQQLVRDLWAILTPVQQSTFEGHIIDWRSFIEQWSPAPKLTKCKRCKTKPLAYPGAAYCGAACCAMAEAGN